MQAFKHFNKKEQPALLSIMYDVVSIKYEA